MKITYVSYLVILAILVAACAKEEINEVNWLLTESKGSNDTVQESDLQQLPPLMQQYLHYTGVVGQPRHYNVRMNAIGDFKTSCSGSWANLKAVDYVTYKPISRNWISNISSAIGPMVALDNYYNGSGRMSIRLAPSISFMEADGPEIDTSEIVTFLSELIYNPSACLNSYITWKTVTDSSIMGTVTDAGITCSGEFFFNSKGQVTRFRTNDRYFANASHNSKETWEVKMWDYKSFEGIMLPASFKATWLFKEGDCEYVHGTFNEIVYDINNI